MKRSEVSIKTRSTPASLSFKGQATKHTTVKWSIDTKCDWLIALFAPPVIGWTNYLGNVFHTSFDNPRSKTSRKEKKMRCPGGIKK